MSSINAKKTREEEKTDEVYERSLTQDREYPTLSCLCFVGEWDELLTLINLDENAKMTDCYFEKKDWRACTAEVSSLSILLFYSIISTRTLSMLV